MRRLRPVVAIVLFLAVPLPAASADQTPPAAGCAGSDLPVRLSPEGPGGGAPGEHVYVELCLPGRPVSTVQVLVHGMTYDHRYWDFPDPRGGTSRYSYVAAALRAGYATLALDRIGSGRSSHPFSRFVDIDSNAFVVHQAIQALRRGDIPAAGGTRPTFSSVVLVGHSYGSFTTWFESSRYHDVDAVILTGVTHRPNMPRGPIVVFSDLHSAVSDPAFAGNGWDPGYLTSKPGTRYELFYAPATADPAVVALDEATKQTVSSAEIDTFPRILGAPLDIRAPVLLVNGDRDGLFCGAAPIATDCSSPETLMAAERPYLGERLPSLDAVIVPGGGHDLNQMGNAAVLFDAAMRWTDRHL